MYLLLNQTLNTIPYKYRNPFVLCDVMVAQYPDDYVVIHPVETVQQQFNLYSTAALQDLYNRLGYPHQLDRVTLVTRLCEFCYWAAESVVNKKGELINKKVKNISLKG